MIQKQFGDQITVQSNDKGTRSFFMELFVTSLVLTLSMIYVLGMLQPYLVSTQKQQNYVIDAVQVFLLLRISLIVSLLLLLT